jgi:hypothetical protein
LQDLLCAGNPFYEGEGRGLSGLYSGLAGKSSEERRVEVIRNVPALKKLDGEMVKGEERDKALGAAPPP